MCDDVIVIKIITIIGKFHSKDWFQRVNNTDACLEKKWARVSSKPLINNLDFCIYILFQPLYKKNAMKKRSL